MKETLSIRPSLILEEEKVKEKKKSEHFLSPDVSPVGTDSRGAPPCRKEEAARDEAEGAKRCGAAQSSAGLGV